MKDYVKKISIKEFVEQGFLQEANRLFFHPRGLALEVFTLEDGAMVFGEPWDYRKEKEGIVFTDLTKDFNKIKADNVERELEKHREEREELFGNIIQPIGSKIE